MNYLDAIILGLLQGLSEFLPISSSGHMMLYQSIKKTEPDVFFFLICHLGTLLSVFLVFRKDIFNFFFDKKNLKNVVISILPLFPIALFKHIIEDSLFRFEFLGYYFIVTSIVLFLGNRFGKEKISSIGVRDAFWIGIFQAIAILPGVSRSGMTISVARLRDIEIKEAIKYSFMLAVPTILGGFILELKDYYLGDISTQASLGESFVGAAVAFIAGYITLKSLVNFPSKFKFNLCIGYTMAIGILTLALSRFWSL